MGMNICPLCLYQCSVTTVQIKWCNLLSTQSKINVKNELTTVSRRGIQRVKVVSAPIRLISGPTGGSLNFETEIMNARQTLIATLSLKSSALAILFVPIACNDNVRSSHFGKTPN